MEGPLDANFEGFTEEQKAEYRRCARLVHAAFLGLEPISSGFRMKLRLARNDGARADEFNHTEDELTEKDLRSFAILEQKACPFLTLGVQVRASRAPEENEAHLDMVESPQARGFLEEKLRSYGYI